MILIPAYYFDGRTSHRYAVCLRVDGKTAMVSGEITRRTALAQLRVSEKSGNAPRKLTFEDGAYLEILDSPLFDKLLRASGHRDSLAVRMQQSWRATLAALAATVFLLFTGYQYGLPLLTGLIAQAVPANVERRLGYDTLALLDQGMLQASELPEERRAAILRRFSALRVPRQPQPQAELVFRKSRSGPNAYALPGGRIVLTDELVMRLDNDDAIAAVLAHELGHLHERHLLRRMLQGVATATAMTLLLGDLSAVAANLPTLLMDLKYSRDAELEADDYAVRLLRLNGVSGDALVAALEGLEADSHGQLPYLATHPELAERIARIRGYQAPER